ncbi:retrovirus-related pol polyprotein from transposon TNT 1-94 [Tanacetum coccineum]|uniref:Retrovirus-related pol polyprotein from transposon TNT 1-94 n=1 Tax=Tanacetum coccineum TaxID=301880 RepID=A0ABQ5CWC6_9ASTR
MDSMIPIGQKNTLAEYMILSGADNRPPMLDKDLYDSWKSRMELYMQNREHERMILESVEHGPLIWPTIEENGSCQGSMGKNSTTNASLPPEWSNFVTDVKLVKDFHTTNFDQLHAYLQQHELHANKVCIMGECNHDPLALVANHQQTLSHFNTYQSLYNNPQFQQQFSSSSSPQYGSIHPTQHYSTTHPSTLLAISYPSTPYSNAYTSTVHQDAYPQPQSIPQIEYTVSTVNQQTHLAEFPRIDSGLAVPVFKQGNDPSNAINKMMSFLSTFFTSHLPSTNNQANISRTGGNNSGQQRVVKCFNCQGEGHMARQCPKPKRKRDATWFRDKVLLVEAQGNGKVLNKEELEFLADLGVAEGPCTQTVITHNAAYQADDLDAYDSDCDDFSTAKAVLMANLSSYRSDVLSEVPHSENTHTDMLNQSVQEMSYSEQTHLVNYPENEITSDSNIIPYSQYLLETQNAVVNKDNLIASESLSAELERYKERVKLLEEIQNVDLSTQEKLIMDDIIWEKNAQFADFEKEINYLKQTLSEQSKEKELLTKTFNVFKNKSKEKEAKNIDKEIALEKKVKELDNIVCKMGQSAQIVYMLTKPQVFYDNLKQALGFQKPFYLKKAQQIRPMLYDGSVIAKETNVISIADFEETLMLEEESRSKMLLKQSDPMVLEKKVNIKPINYAELNRLSKDFDIVNIVVNSLLDLNTSMNVNSSVAMNDSVNYVEMCNKCLELKAKLIKQHNMVEKDEYNRLSKSFSKLEQHCISLELAMQLNKDIFQKNNTSVNQTKPSFYQLFELNNLKAELQAKDTTIEKLKANIKRLNKTSTTNNVKKDIDNIETINIELEHRVTKLIAENEHLKQNYKQLYDSIKPSRVRAEEHVDSLVNQLNQKSVKITDLNAQLQEKVFVITALKNNLRKFKGKDIVDNVAQASNATTIAPGMEIVEQAKSLNPIDSASYSACKYVKLIQELLGYVRDTCPNIHKPSEKLVVVKPINKNKTVRVSRSTKSSRSKSTDNIKNDRILQISSSIQKKNKVEDHSRIVNSMFNARHELCFLEFVSDMNTSFKSKSVKKAKKKEEWKPVVQIVLWYLDSGCSKHMTGDRSHLTNFVHKFLGIIKFSNDQISKIMRYGDYQIGNITISSVYYVEGLGHNIFSVGQFCDSDLEVAFRKHTCFVYNLKGVDLLSGSRETNLYTLSIGDMMASSLICLLSKASKTKSWLWHRRLSHLNFGAINHLAKHGLVRCLPKLKFEKAHMCSACSLGKSKKQLHKRKSEDTNQEKLYLLHMDLCGPMRVASINGKKYIHVIMDDYSRFTWVKFLSSNDEAPDFIIKFLKMIQVILNATIRNIRIDNGTEFVNQTMRDYYEQVGISHETSVARTP